jgi:hypothetical protein
MELRSDAIDISGMDIDDIDTITIDCDRCEVRGDACAECVISVLLGAPPAVEWDNDEQRAVDALVEAGMVPQLRLVPIAPMSGVPVSTEQAHTRRPA